MRGDSRQLHDCKEFKSHLLWEKWLMRRGPRTLRARSSNAITAEIRGLMVFIHTVVRKVDENTTGSARARGRNTNLFPRASDRNSMA